MLPSSPEPRAASATPWPSASPRQACPLPCTTQATATAPQAVADEIVAAGGRAMVVAADIADEAQVAALFDQVEASSAASTWWSTPPGIMLLSPLAELDLDEFDRMHRTNVRGTFVVSQQAARRVRDRRRDHQLLQLGHQARAADLHRLRGHQGRGRRDDADPGQGAARPRRHRQRRRPRPDRHAAVPRRQAAAGHRPPAQGSRRWNGSASPTTSPRPSPSSPAPPAGSTARSSTPTAASSDPRAATAMKRTPS